MTLMSTATDNAPDGVSMTFAARDGFELTGRLFTAPSTPTAIAILAPATGVRGRFYAPFAAHLAACGVTTLVPDYRGIGESRPARFRGRRLRHFHAGFASWARLDIPAACDALVAHFPHMPLVYIGHSLGGQVFPLVPQASRVAAALFVASQVGWVGHWKSLPTLPKYLGLMASLGSATLALGYGPGRVFGGEDLPPRAAADWGAWAFHPKYLHGWHADARRRAASVTAPMAFIRLTDDLDFAPEAAVHDLISWYVAAPRTEIVLTPKDAGVEAIGHFGFFRPRIGKPLWHRASDWLLAAIASAHTPTPVTSGARA
jgi:predicted alpha/beta hydrolase